MYRTGDLAYYNAVSYTHLVVVGVYDEENRKNISKMKEVCDCYCDRMDAAIENICLTI